MIIITNPGLVDAMAFHLIGASSKRDDKNTIGFFGSGLKYALAGLIRNNIPFQVWRGDTPLNITTEKVEMRGQRYDRIVIDGQPTSFTTDMGPKWEVWMLIRELYANAVDEGGEMAVTDDYAQFIGPDRTTIILPEVTPELEQVLREQDILFCRGRDVLYEDERIRVYEEVGDGGFYVKGILVGRKGPGFGYELKKLPYDLNEERQLRSPLVAQSATIGAILSIDDPKMVRRIVSRSKAEGLERDMLRSGYLMSFHANPTAPAWHKYMFVPPSKAEFASTDPDTVLVSHDIYEHCKHPRKWAALEWKAIDKGQNHLDEALAIIETVAPGSLPKGVWRFGVPDNDSLAISMRDGDNWVSHTYIGEPVNKLAAIIIMHLSLHDATAGLRIIHNLIAR